MAKEKGTDIIKSKGTNVGRVYNRGVTKKGVYNRGINERKSRED